MLDQQTLKSLLDYDPTTGIFRWISKPRFNIARGDIAGSPNQFGYIRIRVCGKRYCAHRLAWLYMTGDWPRVLIDHIDGDSGNNRWNNLRLADPSQNGGNAKLSRRNSTGFKGVSRQNDRFHASIRIGGRKIHIGSYATPEEAHEAYLYVSEKHFGEYARSG